MVANYSFISLFLKFFSFFLGKVHQIINKNIPKPKKISRKTQNNGKSFMKSTPHFPKTLLKTKKRVHFHYVAIILMIVTGCATSPPYKQIPPVAGKPKDTISKPESFSLVKKNWLDLPGWVKDDLPEAWPAFLKNCEVLRKKDKWKSICEDSRSIKTPSKNNLRTFFQLHFSPHQILTSEASDRGLITGYYEPLINGNRFKTKVYKHPILGIPNEVTATKMRGKPPQYFPRQVIEENFVSMQIPVLFWVANKVDLFFLQIQGSGRVSLPSGKVIKIGFGMTNGLPYTSIGKLLVDQGEIKLNEASMSGIKKWAAANPHRLDNLLNKNQRYVFFKTIDNSDKGPIGAMNIPLTPKRSLAVDPKFIPLGSPVYLATTWPNSNKPLNRLVLAQDTGNAIKGPLRGDFFWGFGPTAGHQAGKMKQAVRMWILLPNPPTNQNP